jgi:hypothetical protein
MKAICRQGKLTPRPEAVVFQNGVIFLIIEQEILVTHNSPGDVLEIEAMFEEYPYAPEHESPGCELPVAQKTYCHALPRAYALGY